MPSSFSPPAPRSLPMHVLEDGTGMRISSAVSVTATQWIKSAVRGGDNAED